MTAFVYRILAVFASLQQLGVMESDMHTAWGLA